MNTCATQTGFAGTYGGVYVCVENIQMLGHVCPKHVLCCMFRLWVEVFKHMFKEACLGHASCHAC